jgi:hypothetical protein
VENKFSTVLLVEETGVTRENHLPVASHRQTKFSLSKSFEIYTQGQES